MFLFIGCVLIEVSVSFFDAVYALPMLIFLDMFLVFGSMLFL